MEKNSKRLTLQEKRNSKLNGVDMKRRVIFGPPGTGKTTYLMDLLDSALEQYKPENIAFVSYTKRGTYEGADKAKVKFGLSKSDMRYFKTIHSLCFGDLGATRSGMISKSHYKLLSEQTGIPFTGYYTEDFSSSNDAYLHALSMQKHNPEFANKLKLELNQRTSDYIEFQYKAMKKQLGVLDFDDLLTMYLERGDPLDVKVAFIDEGQDLTPLQWKVITKLFSNADTVYVAGDDDQAVYEWSGANVNDFLSFSSDNVVLKQSYRLPANVLTMANKISHDIGNRKRKSFRPKDTLGKLSTIDRLYNAKLKGGELVLARTNWLLRGLVADMHSKGLPYNFKGRPSINKFTVKAIQKHKLYEKGQLSEKEMVKYGSFFTKIDKTPWQKTIDLSQFELTHYDSVISRGSMHLDPVKFETFHSSKGSENENVYLLPELSARVHKHMFKNYDSELRCLYVGLTRTKSDLTVLLPQGKHFYPSKYFS